MYFYTELAVFDATTSILSCFSSQSKPLSRLRMASVRIALPGQIKCCSSMNNRSPQQLKKINDNYLNFSLFQKRYLRKK